MNPDRIPKKLDLSDLLYGQNRPPKKVGVNRHFQAILSLTAHGMIL